MKYFFVPNFMIHPDCHFGFLFLNQLSSHSSNALNLVVLMLFLILCHKKCLL